LRFDADEYRDREAAARLRLRRGELPGDGCHGADANATEFYRCPSGQTTDAVVHQQHIFQVTVEGALSGRVLVGIEIEGGIGLDRQAQRQVIRNPEADAAAEQGFQGCHIDAETVGIELHIDTA
jgi:hypothetical protein